MLHHTKYTRTRYEYTISNKDGQVAFTLWFSQRNPSLNKVYRLVQENLDAIRKATNTNDIVWNGDKTITAGEYTGRMTDKTLLQARG